MCDKFIVIIMNYLFRCADSASSRGVPSCWPTCSLCCIAYCLHWLPQRPSAATSSEGSHSVRLYHVTAGQNLMVKIWWGLKFVDIFHMFFKIQIQLAKGWYTIANFSHNWAIYKNGPPGRFFIKSTVAQMGHNVFYLLIFYNLFFLFFLSEFCLILTFLYI